MKGKLFGFTISMSPTTKACRSSSRTELVLTGSCQPVLAISQASQTGNKLMQASLNHNLIFACYWSTASSA